MAEHESRGLGIFSWIKAKMRTGVAEMNFCLDVNKFDRAENKLVPQQETRLRAVGSFSTALCRVFSAVVSMSMLFSGLSVNAQNFSTLPQGQTPTENFAFDSRASVGSSNLGSSGVPRELQFLKRISHTTQFTAVRVLHPVDEDDLTIELSQPIEAFVRGQCAQTLTDVRMEVQEYSRASEADSRASLLGSSSLSDPQVLQHFADILPAGSIIEVVGASALKPMPFEKTYRSTAIEIRQPENHVHQVAGTPRKKTGTQNLARYFLRPQDVRGSQNADGASRLVPVLCPNQALDLKLIDTMVIFGVGTQLALIEENKGLLGNTILVPRGVTELRLHAVITRLPGPKSRP